MELPEEDCWISTVQPQLVNEHLRAQTVEPLMLCVALATALVPVFGRTALPLLSAPGAPLLC